MVRQDLSSRLHVKERLTLSDRALMVDPFRLLLNLGDVSFLLDNLAMDRFIVVFASSSMLCSSSVKCAGVLFSRPSSIGSVKLTFLVAGGL